MDAANANTAVIGKTARTLAASNNDWKTSWEGVWTPLPGGDGKESDPTTKASPEWDNNGSGGSGSSNGTRNAGLIAGLAVGIGGGVSLLALVGFVLYRRGRHGTGFACCGLRIVKDKEHAGGYGPTAASPGSPSPQQEQQGREVEVAYKSPKYYNRHELPLNEAPSQLPDDQVPRPLTGELPTAAAPEEGGVGVPKEAQPQRQVFEMAGDEYHERRQ